MLIVIDFGDAVSLQLSAPIVTALGLTYEDFSALPLFLAIQVASSVAVLVVLGLLWLPPCTRASGRAAARPAEF